MQQVLPDSVNSGKGDRHTEAEPEQHHFMCCLFLHSEKNVFFVTSLILKMSMSSSWQRCNLAVSVNIRNT